MPPERSKTAVFEVDMVDDKIARFKWAPGTVVDEELARESYRKVMEVAAGKPVALLTDISEMKSLTREARDYYASVGNLVAQALVATSPVSVAIANFFIAIKRPPVPVRLFTSEEKAMEWLKAMTR